MENPSPAAHVLMKKGKRGAAAYVHSDCAIKGSNRLLNEVLDILLNPRKSINEWETIDWLKWLMAGGKTPDEFSNLGKSLLSLCICLIAAIHLINYSMMAPCTL